MSTEIIQWYLDIWHYILSLHGENIYHWLCLLQMCATPHLVQKILICLKFLFFFCHIVNVVFPLIIPPASTKLIGGYTGITLSVCPSVCPSVDRIVSALYLQEYSSDPFHICTSYQATSEGVSCVMPISKFKNFSKNFGDFFKFVTFTLSSFDLGSNMTQWYG